MVATKELSIFVDESGDFGPYESHAPYYIFTLVLHQQQDSIQEQIEHLNTGLMNAGLPQHHCLHAGPIIRREEDYTYLDIAQRRKLLGLMVSFIRSSPILHTSFLVEKRNIHDGMGLTIALSRALSQFLLQHYEYLSAFDRMIVYYDNGQIDLNKILASVFSSFFANVEFRKVQPSQYRLFQAADLICTFRLLEEKAEHGVLSRSEEGMLGSMRDFRKNYLKPIQRKRIDP